MVVDQSWTKILKINLNKIFTKFSTNPYRIKMWFKNKFTFLISLIYLLTVNTYSQSRIFDNNFDILIYIHGKGLYLNEAIDSNKLKSISNWLYYPVMDNDGNLWANGFDGVKYLGLIKYCKNGTLLTYDLVENGLASNYLSGITVSENKLSILSFNSIYESDIHSINFEKLKTDKLGNIYDINYFNNNLMILSNEGLHWKDNLVNISLQLPNIKEQSKIVATNQREIFVSALDMLIVINADTKKVKVINHNSQPGFINDFNDYNYLIGNNAIALLSQKGMIIIHKDEYYHLENLKCNDALLKNSGAILLNNGMLNYFTFENISKNISQIERYSNKYSVEFFNNNTFGILVKSELASDSKLLNSTKEISVVTKLKELTNYNKPEWPIHNYERTQVLLLNIMIGLFAIIFFSINYLILRRKKYYLLPAIILPLLFLLIGSTDIINEFSIPYIIPTVVWIGSFFLFIFICLNDANNIIHVGAFIRPLHEFSHGSIGINNIVRLSMFLKHTLNNQQNETEINRTIAGISEQYKKYTFPAYLQLNSQLPLVFSVFVQQIKLYFHIYKINILIRDYAKARKISPIRSKIIKDSNLIVLLFEKLKWQYYAMVKTNVNTVISEVISHSIERCEKSNIKIVTKGLDAYLPSVIIPPGKFYTIVDNIISNAIEAANESQQSDKYIEVYIPQNNLLNLHIVISNNGNKIADEVIDSIFQPSTSTKESGGYGLFEAQDIANSFLGDVKLIESNENRTSFLISLRTYYNA